MNNYKELIERLREYAEWARANEWEVPLCMGDSLEEAADAIEILTAELAEERHRHDRLQDWDRGMTEKLASAELQCKQIDEGAAIVLKKCDAVLEELARVKAERDALLKIMSDDADCDYCKHDLSLPCVEEIVEACEECTREKTPCCGCGGNNWEWCGAKEDT